MDKSDLYSWPSAVGMIVIAGLYGGIVLAIYPGWPEIWLFLKVNMVLDTQAPAWAQAVAGLLAVVVALFLPMIERKRNERDHKAQMAEACFIFASEACLALDNSKRKFEFARYPYPESSLERLRNVERIGLILAGKNLHPEMLVPVTRILREVSLAIQATEDVTGKNVETIQRHVPSATNRLANAQKQLDAIEAKCQAGSAMKDPVLNEFSGE